MAKQMTPATRLSGLKLDGGWTVKEMFQRSSNDTTGGGFSRGYLVERSDGALGFLKALDLARAMDAEGDFLDEMKKHVDRFLFERSVLEFCRASKLSRIATPLASGIVDVPGFDAPFGRVNYIIFELADDDLRQHLDKSRTLDLSSSLRYLHNIAVGLKQLHVSEVAHQDLKPSNVLVYQREAKIGDLGRASRKGHNGPYETMPIPGDPYYAPPEQLYRYLDPQWARRRIGCDAYHLGSLIHFFFTRVGFTQALVSKLAAPQRPHAWSDTFEAVLPYVRQAFNEVLRTFRTTLAEHFPDSIAEEITLMVGQLCDPELDLRGHPRSRRLPETQFSLERYISRLDALAQKAELQVKKAKVS